MNDTLGDRMKRYANVTRNYLPRRTYTIIRLDGSHFHTYTRGLDHPYDQKFGIAMQLTLQHLFEHIQGSFLGYVQSDEISLVLYDFARLESKPWFGGNIQKITSVSAGMASSYFTHVRTGQGDTRLAYFDSRVWTIPDPTEV